jgi:hypothetical protein
MSLNKILPSWHEEQFISTLIYTDVPCFATGRFQLKPSSDLPLEILCKLLWYALKMKT